VSLWIFDTDHVSLVLRGHPKVVSRLGQLPEQTSTTIITVQEIFNGWVGQLNQASVKPKTILDQYHHLYLTIELLKRLPIQEFNVSAFNLYEDLLVQHLNLRKKRLQKDMRIAAIALSLEATVVTRNRRDFAQVPRLKLEDWTI
jgi:tRNA(fMet)-specific endonuclease VapC